MATWLANEAVGVVSEAPPNKAAETFPVPVPRLETPADRKQSHDPRWRLVSNASPAPLTCGSLYNQLGASGRRRHQPDSAHWYGSEDGTGHPGGSFQHHLSTERGEHLATPHLYAAVTSECHLTCVTCWPADILGTALINFSVPGVPTLELRMVIGLFPPAGGGACVSGRSSSARRFR